VENEHLNDSRTASARVLRSTHAARSLAVVRGLAGIASLAITGAFFIMMALAFMGALTGTALAEDRPVVPRGGPEQHRPHSWIRDTATPKPVVQRSPSGFWPIDMLTAYGISPSGGRGATVAIVDAYDSPNALVDLNTFSTQFALPTFPAAKASTCEPTFKKVNQTGGAALPQRNSGWEIEINLDTQWVHAIAPCANIVLVEAASAGTNDLLAAVGYAKTIASVVSMSWGGGESRFETVNDSVFVHSGVTFLASSGDSGGQVEWPSSSPNVIAVGGTQLTANAAGGLAPGFLETAWKGSGGGCSIVEAALPFQKSFLPATPVCKNRAVPDVSMSGGDESAVAVVVSRQGGWFEVYGTSLSVQLFAGVVAIANGLRSTPLNNTLSDLYTDAAGAPLSMLYLDNYRDVTAYYSGESAGPFAAGKGWDFVTGLGAPLVNSLVYGYLMKQ
jgi:subtilase family serine protease